MARPPHRPAALSGKIFDAPTAQAAGMSRRQLQSKPWRRLHRGVHGEATTTTDPLEEHRQRIRAAALVIPSGAAITALSALAWRGFALLPLGSPVRIVVGREHRFGPVKGLKIHQSDLPIGDIAVGSVRCTTPLRTAWDAAMYEDVTDAVAAIDLLTRKGALDLGALRVLAARPGMWGRNRVRRALALVDPAAESPQESRLRTKLVLAGLPAPTAQFNIRHAGHFVARVDLAWPQARLAVEYDGLWHGTTEQFMRDRRRLNAVLRTEWHVVHVTIDRLTEDFDSLVQELALLLEERTK